jgi:hypothetical protein
VVGIQFFFALGTFVSPMITKPFLANNKTDSNVANINMTSVEVKRSRIEIPFGKY